MELNKVVSKPDLMELIIFEGATHDFDRSNINMEYLGHRLVYNPDATKVAKGKTKEFFYKHLLGK